MSYLPWNCVICQKHGPVSKDGNCARCELMKIPEFKILYEKEAKDRSTLVEKKIREDKMNKLLDDYTNGFAWKFIEDRKTGAPFTQIGFWRVDFSIGGVVTDCEFMKRDENLDLLDTFLYKEFPESKVVLQTLDPKKSAVLIFTMYDVHSKEYITTYRHLPLNDENQKMEI